MIQENELSQIGKFNHPHGVNGEISAVIDYDINPADLRCIIMNMDGIYVPFFIKSWRPRSSHAVLLTLDGIDTEEKVSVFSNKNIYALTAELPADNDDPDDEGFYVNDIIGYRINTIDRALDGKIIDIDESTQNILFVVEDNQRGRVLIPAVDEFIENIDFDNKILTVSLPSGLLDI